MSDTCWIVLYTVLWTLAIYVPMMTVATLWWLREKGRDR